MAESFIELTRMAAIASTDEVECTVISLSYPPRQPFKPLLLDSYLGGGYSATNPLFGSRV